MEKNKNIWFGNVDKQCVQDKETVTKDEKGSDVKTITKETVVKPVKVVVAMPTRVLQEEAEMVYASTLSNLINKNINTKFTLRQKLFGPLLREVEMLQQEYIELTKTEEKDLSEKEKARLVTLNTEFGEKFKEMLSQEEAHQLLFNQTAEAIADNRLTVFWALHLAYLEENGKLESFFEGKTFEDKLKNYDKIEGAANEFEMKVIKIISQVVGLWLRGYANTQDAIDKALKVLDEKEKADLAELENSLKEVK